MGRPADKRGVTLGGERIDAALDAREPAIVIAQQDRRRRRDFRPQLAGPPRPRRQRRGAGERLLAGGGHDPPPPAAAQPRVAPAPLVLPDDGAAAPVAAPA